MEKICVYTCITGDYDELREVKVKEKGVDYLCFTNLPLKSKTWKIIKIADDKLNDHYLSRKIKMLGHPIIDENYDVSIWTDASVIFQKSVREFLKEYADLEHYPFAVCKHHMRNSIKEEADFCIAHQKDKKETIKKQLAFYKQEKFMDDKGLYEMTVFVKKHHDKIVKETMKLWFDMIMNYSKRDQLSFMYAISKTGLKVKEIPLNVWNNDYLLYQPHKKKDFGITYQVYYDKGTGFQEETSDIFLYEQTQDGKLKATLSFKDDVRRVRIDPCDVGGCYLELELTPSKQVINMHYLQKDKYLTLSNDPQIILDKAFKAHDKLSFTVWMKEASKEELISYLKDETQKNSELKGLEDQLKNTIYTYENSMSWKITAPLRFISHKIKGKN